MLVDTGGGIPSDFLVDWKVCGPVVPASDLVRAPDIVLEFHGKQSPEQFLLRQQENRRLFEQYLSPEGFFARFPFAFPA